MTDSRLDPIAVDVKAGVAPLTLDRVGAMNAIDLPMARRFSDVVEALSERADVRAMLVTGRGRAFCAGGDVSAMGTADDPPAYLAELAATMHGGLVRLSRMRVPVVAAVNGSVAGAGLGLALAADLVIAGVSARFLTAYCEIGLTPDCGVSHLLPQVIGLRRALELTLTGRVLSAAEAQAWGLVTEVTADEAAHPRAESIAATLAGGAWPALGESRGLLRAAGATTYADHLDLEARTISRVSASADAVGRIEAFVARRAHGKESLT